MGGFRWWHAPVAGSIAFSLWALRPGWTAANIGNAVASKSVLITGANSGVGYYTALELVRAGANVTMVCRSAERGQKACDSIASECKGTAGAGKVNLIVADVSSLGDVRRVADTVNATGQPLDVLINNAAIWSQTPYSRSADGIETQMATGFLGAFALTGGVLPSLLKSEAPRVVNTSTAGILSGNLKTIVWNPTEEEFKKLGNMKVHCDMKLALHTWLDELGRRYPTVKTVAAHPGGTLSKMTDGDAFLRAIVMPTDVGARTLLRAAAEPDIPPFSYIGPRCVLRGPPEYGAMRNAQMSDPELTKMVWDTAVELTGVKY